MTTYHVCFFIEICIVPVLFERPIPNNWNINGDQPFLAIFSAFLDNNIKPTQIFDNNITRFTWLHCQCNQSSQCVLAKTTCPDFTKKWLIRSTNLLSLSMPCHDNSMSNSMEIPKLVKMILTIRTPIFFCLPALPVSPRQGSFKGRGYGWIDKIWRYDS